MRRRNPPFPLAPKAAFAAVVSIGFLAAGCGSSAYARRTEADRQLSIRLQQVLQTAGIDQRLVQAKSYCSVVTLVGEVPSQAESVRAEAAAQSTQGVARVNNLILVSNDSSKAAGSSPAGGVSTNARAKTGP